MTPLAALMILPAGLCASGFYRWFETPQLLGLMSVGSACLLLLAFSGRRLAAGPLPRTSTALLMLAVVALVPGLTASEPQAVVDAGWRAGALLAIAWTVRSLSARAVLWLVGSIHAYALVQAGVAGAELLAARGVIPALGPLGTSNGWAVGSVGNPEFLATVLAVGAFCGLHLRTLAAVRLRVPLAAGSAILIAAIAATGSKGTLALVVLLAVATVPRGRRLVAGTWPLVAIVMAALVWRRPAGSLGRLEVWLASGAQILATPLHGVGLGRFDDAWMASTYRLMTASSWFRTTFAPYTGDVRDAHDVILQAGVELGIGGALVAAVGAWYAWRARRRLPRWLGAALGLLVCKSLYTVLLGSTSGALVAAIFLGLAARGEGKATEAVATPVERGVRIAFAGMVLTLAIMALPRIWADRDLGGAMRALYSGDAAGAAAFASKGLESAPADTDLLLAGALAEHQIGHDEIAARLAVQATEAAKTMDVFKRAAHILYLTSRWPLAAPLLETLRVVYPEHRTTMTKLAMVRLRKGDRAGAQALARLALATHGRRISYTDERNDRLAAAILAKTAPAVGVPP
jgi:hypothetical protein